MRLPCFVGIGDEPSLRHRRAHGAQALDVASAAKFELEQRMVARFARRRGHRLGGSEREGEGGEHRMKRTDPGD